MKFLDTLSRSFNNNKNEGAVNLEAPSQLPEYNQQENGSLRKKFINSLKDSFGTIRNSLDISSVLQDHINGYNSGIPDPFESNDNDFGNFQNNDHLYDRVKLQQKTELIQKYLSLTSSISSNGQTVLVDHMDYSVMESPSFFSRKEKVEILSDLSFYLKPGMMVLLLGDPSAGVSTLFKCLTNRIPSRGLIEGDVLFNNQHIDSDHHHKKYIFVQQSDNHIPTLTVKETLDFAINCQSNLNNENKKELRDTILQILNLTHVQDTLIGNHAIRGISGGQKKRMTIAVELVKGASTIFLDNCTSGLDSTSAFELLHSIQMISKIANVPALISLLQPSPEIFSLFTHVLMMKDGQCLFFEEKERVFEHFSQFNLECNDKQNPAEFLSSIYHLAQLNNDCQLKTTTDFVIAYKQSQYYKTTLVTVSQEKLVNNNNFNNNNEILLSNQLVIGDDNEIYKLSLFYQIILNLKRVFLMTTRDRPAIVSRVVKASLLGTIIGTLFLQLDSSQKSANLIPSLSFFLLTFVVFGSLAGVHQLFTERPTFYDQMMGKYYNCIAYFFSGLVSDLIWNMLDVVIFSSISYWLIGLNPTTKRFLFFILQIYLLDCLVNRVSKMVSIFSPTATIASTLAPLYFSLFLLMAGYMIPKGAIGPYWIWMHYISPFKWVYESILINEVIGQIYTCDPLELMPPSFYPSINISYPNGFSGHQVCPITTGEQILISKDIRADSEYRKFSIYILLGMYSLFSLISIIGLSKVRFDNVGSNKKINKKNSNSQNNNRSIKLVTSPSSSPSQNHNQQIANNKNDSTMDKCYFTFKNLSYKVIIKKRHGIKINRTLLDNISGFVKPGTLVALMGSSGAGKSTLLDILANRKSTGIITGEILLNGKPRDQCFNRYVAYVEQEDQLPDFQTVREAITFSALLRLPREMKYHDKMNKVEYILDVLELRSIASCIIGKQDHGITQEQRKRVNIGVELASDPFVLFLDEPTTNLNAKSAEVIMNIVKKITLNGKSVICTIHQPSESIFKKFDSVLLLTQGGFMAYFGELGPNCRTILNYCSDLGYQCKENKNVADFLLDFSASFDSKKRLQEHDKIIPSIRSKIISSNNQDIENNNIDNNINNNNNFDNDTDIIDCYKISELNRNNLEIIESGLPIGFKSKVFVDKNATSFLFQFWMLLCRFFICSFRRKNVIFTRIARSLLLSMVTGTLYLNIGDDQAGVINRISFIFFTSTFASISCLSNIPGIFEDRYLFYHEIDSNAYRHLSYIFAMIISDLPFTMIYSLIFSAPIYWIVGLQSDSSKFIFFIFTYYIYLQVLVSFSQLLGMVSPSLSVANEITGISFSIFSLFAGFIIKKDDIPRYFNWLNYISITKYMVESLTINEMEGDDAKFHCTQNQLIQVPIQYTPVNSSIEKIVFKPFCQISTGSDVLHQFHLKDSYKNDNILVLAFMYVLFLVLLLILSKILKFKK
ncbi:hypothetical protein DICPUDRAFT_36905 [Dictyostelium purpureum]|uniref:ABC transporter domain-containing protein n=1 Tax=Dictyostelium purpureum TaxID=5786 RepID=F0ZRX2_DICPU|nr:uncharacterized protein DICPUDRAFT_36905 [Dictyostelium purpureum]EGC33304.1 hypothetical protein DICPUDRAFT_36905 [Dictyostelium purpureum]|eukprot:XP_003290160.1 hypothetical protein DICPUDRAFT_36905 [Dictyostelium purpureum]